MRISWVLHNLVQSTMLLLFFKLWDSYSYAKNTWFGFYFPRHCIVLWNAMLIYGGVILKQNTNNNKGALSENTKHFSLVCATTMPKNMLAKCN